MPGGAYKEDYVDRIAQRYGWRKTASASSRNAQSVSYRKDSCKITIWLTSGTCGSYLDHPKQGKTQLFRRRNGDYNLEDIFENPRIHTEEGYHKKANRKSKKKQEKNGIKKQTEKTLIDDDHGKRIELENTNVTTDDIKRIPGVKKRGREELSEDDEQPVERPKKRSKISCKYGSFCFREDCYYEHRCRYVGFCQRKHCRYIHDLPEEEENWWYMQKCRYWPNCLNPHCKFQHDDDRNSFIPTACRYGALCTRRGCWYTH